MPNQHDLFIYGATGFTGRLIAEYLLTTQGVGGKLRWAMAGRNLDKLKQVRKAIGAGTRLPLLAADASNPRELARLVGSTKALITTVGPYQRHGEALVKACANAGTDYLDLCGEPVWMTRMIPQLERPARASGARIVFSCGFDSIPFDLGVVFLQHEAKRRFGAALPQVGGRVKSIKGGLSGGTAASALATFEEIADDPQLARTMANPFALTPGFRGPPQPDGESALYDELAASWTGPFMMATINTKNVHRTNALRGHPWGYDFRYDERLMTGGGARGRVQALMLAGGSRAQSALLSFGPSRQLLQRFVLPQPGDGPMPEARAQGRYDLRFHGRSADGRHTLAASVKGDADPGYGSTSKMITEAALCLLNDVDGEATPGGVWTPGAAMGLALVRRLQERAGLRFAIEEQA